MSGRAQLAAATLRELLRDGHTAEIPTVGGSMRPLLAPGEPIRVVHATAARVRPGDVVLVAHDETLICHRLIYVAGGRVVTRGDNAPECDRPLPAAAIVGRVDVPPSPRALLCAVRALLR